MKIRIFCATWLQNASQLPHSTNLLKKQPSVLGQKKNCCAGQVERFSKIHTDHMSGRGPVVESQHPRPLPHTAPGYQGAASSYRTLTPSHPSHWACSGAGGAPPRICPCAGPRDAPLLELQDPESLYCNWHVFSSRTEDVNHIIYQ